MSNNLVFTELSGLVYFKVFGNGGHRQKFNQKDGNATSL